ncbi:MAG TPA: MarR family winged helix-turn-helix transcriptional regulator [Clostridia bacterium]|nr:MarR family winged helix-turn-helix transcriptional regulator [Clostridia bacterium]
MEIAEFKNIVWDYTRKIAESMNCIFAPVSEEYGLTMIQTRILMELYKYESHTIGSLADSTCIAGANISAMCKKLEVQGLLERARNREDERVVLVALTKLGKETTLEIDRLCNDKISQHLANEAEETFEDIIAGLQKLDELLKKINCVEKK